MIKGESSHQARFLGSTTAHDNSRPFDICPLDKFERITTHGESVYEFMSDNEDAVNSSHIFDPIE